MINYYQRKISYAYLNKRLAIESADEINDDLGGKVLVWRQLITLWAFFEQLSDSWEVISKRFYNNSRYLIAIRSTKFIQTKLISAKIKYENLRFKYRNRLFTPELINLDTKKSLFFIKAAEIL